MKKNIGLLIPSLNSGGAERVVSRLSHILEKDYNIFIILYEDTYMKYKVKGTIINMNIGAKGNKLYKLLLLLRRIVKLKKIKKQYQLYAVISFLDSPNIVNILSKTNKCKTIISIRNYNRYKNKVYKFLLKMIYRKSDAITTVSNVLTKKIINEFKICKDKVITIYNPYEISEITKQASQTLEDNYKEFFSEGMIFISVGRQVYQKGYWHLIKAFKMLYEKCPDVKLVLVGRDDSNGKVKKLVNNLGLDKSILIIGYHENPFKFIKNSHVYILTSLYEGFPNAMVEAMACGCPVIATDCKSGPREILNKSPEINKVSKNIEMSDFGILIPPLDFEENWDPSFVHSSEIKLAEAMYLVYKNKKLRETYADKALERASEFSYDKCRKSYLSLIESI